MTAPPKYFKTSDMDSAAFCVVRGFPLLGVEPAGSRKIFVFEPGAAACATEYFSGAECVARDFAQALRELKRAVFDPTKILNSDEVSHVRPRRQQ